MKKYIANVDCFFKIGCGDIVPQLARVEVPLQVRSRRGVL